MNDQTETVSNVTIGTPHQRIEFNFAPEDAVWTDKALRISGQYFFYYCSGDEDDLPAEADKEFYKGDFYAWGPKLRGTLIIPQAWIEETYCDSEGKHMAAWREGHACSAIGGPVHDLPKQIVEFSEGDTILLDQLYAVEDDRAYDGMSVVFSAEGTINGVMAGHVVIECAPECAVHVQRWHHEKIHDCYLL